MNIFNRDQIRKIEQTALERYGVSNALLMGRAGEAVAQLAVETVGGDRGSNICVLCGTGNNGGDGFLAALNLHTLGYPVHVFLTGVEAHITGINRDGYQSLARNGIPVSQQSEPDFSQRLHRALAESDLVIDAMVGIGLTGPLHPQTAAIVRLVNASGKRVLSVDIPSGVDCNTGAVADAIQAYRTVALIACNPGHFLYPGAGYSGSLTLSRLGLPMACLDQHESGVHISTTRLVQNMIRPRKLDGHKGNYGHLLVVAGSHFMPGAAWLTARGGVRVGAGLTTLAMPDASMAHIPMIPEIMTRWLPDDGTGLLTMSAAESLATDLAHHSAVVIGPGMTADPQVAAAVKKLVRHSPIPLVLDADGINAFSGQKDKLTAHESPLILTPHPGEMARLTGQSVTEILSDRIQIAQNCAKAWDAWIVLKGAGTVIAAPRGEIWINTTGNPGMASGGTGDVLAGMIGGLLAQGFTTQEAVILGVYLHGAAGDWVAVQHGSIGMTASELADAVPIARRLIQEGKWQELHEI